MQVTVRPLDFLSRVAAVLVLAVLAAWVSMTLAASEVEEASKLSHQELMAYIKDGYDPSFVWNYLYVALLTLVYVALVEGVAFVIRCAVRAVWAVRADRGAEPRTNLLAGQFEVVPPVQGPTAGPAQCSVSPWPTFWL